LKGRSATHLRIEVLSFAGCPHRRETFERVVDVVGTLGVEAHVRWVEVYDAGEAAELRFPGSPTVRIDGTDLEPGVEGRAPGALTCRTYGGSGVPSRELLEKAVAAAAGRVSGAKGPSPGRTGAWIGPVRRFSPRA